ncbi:MAG: DUF1570 domain-containing protein, partial [Planctomycetota bacterium]
IPLKIGSGDTQLMDRWQSEKPLNVRGVNYEWGIKIYRFLAGAEEGAPVTESGGKPSKEELFKRAMAAKLPKDFEDWLKQRHKNASFKIRGKEGKQRSGSRLAYRYYEFVDAINGAYWLHAAAAYEIDQRQIVVLGHIPDAKRRRMLGQLKKSVTSLRLLKDSKRKTRSRKIEGEEFVQIDPELRSKLLAEAVENIKSLKAWDILCTKHYMVLYSFDKGKRGAARAFAKDLAWKMDEINAMYRKYFPPHDKVRKGWSVMRLCRNSEEFQKYGHSPPGVIGWFSPQSKELVLFNAKGQGFKTENVAFHEGWHQYADAYFPGAQLHRWFDEGMGDFFGSMKRIGKNRWKRMASKMRKGTIRSLVSSRKHVPLQEIVRWHKDKFYGGRASDYYAQGWAMVDFFMRRKKYKHHLDTYVKATLETKDTDKATDEAFKGVDWLKLEKEWKAYVKKGL